MDYTGADASLDRENDDPKSKKGKKKVEDEFEEDDDGNMVKKVKRDRFGRPIKECTYTPVKVTLMRSEHRDIHVHLTISC